MRRGVVGVDKQCTDNFFRDRLIDKLWRVDGSSRSNGFVDVTHD